MMIFTLAYRELRSLFLSPLAWSILAIIQLILGYLFLTQLSEFLKLQGQLKMLETAPGATDLVVSPLYGSATYILMMVVPLLTMRILSEERRSRSLSLLFSAPLSMSEIIIGKYLGIIAFLFIMIGMISLMPVSLLFAGNIDLGLLAALILGLFLLVSAFASIGLYMSSLTEQPTVAAVSTFGILLLLWIIDWAGTRSGPDQASNLLGYLSMLRHYEGLARGIFSSTDIIYFVLFIATFIILSIRRLDADRIKG